MLHKKYSRVKKDDVLSATCSSSTAVAATSDICSSTTFKASSSFVSSLNELKLADVLLDLLISYIFANHEKELQESMMFSIQSHFTELNGFHVKLCIDFMLFSHCCPQIADLIVTGDYLHVNLLFTMAIAHLLSTSMKNRTILFENVKCSLLYTNMDLFPLSCMTFKVGIEHPVLIRLQGTLTELFSSNNVVYKYLFVCLNSNCKNKTMITKRPQLSDSKLVLRQENDFDNYLALDYQLHDLKCKECHSQLEEIRSERWIEPIYIYLLKLPYRKSFKQHVMIRSDIVLNIHKEVIVCGYLKPSNLDVHSIAMKKQYCSVQYDYIIDLCSIKYITTDSVSIDSRFTQISSHYGNFLKLILSCFYGSTLPLLLRLHIHPDHLDILEYFIADYGIKLSELTKKWTIEEWKSSTSIAVIEPKCKKDIVLLETLSKTHKVLWIDTNKQINGIDVELLKTKCDLQFELNGDIDASIECDLLLGPNSTPNDASLSHCNVSLQNKLIEQIQLEFEKQKHLVMILINGLCSFLNSPITNEIMMTVYFILKKSQEEPQMNVMDCSICIKMQESSSCTPIQHRRSIEMLLEAFRMEQ